MHALRMAFVALLFLGSSVASAATYYVDGTKGKDKNAGSASAPFRTIGRPLALGLLPGDTVIVRAGTYNEALTIANQALPSSPITFRAAKGAKVIVDGKTTKPANANVGLIEITGAHIVIDGFEITRAKGPGVQSTGKGTVVRNCTLYNNQQAALIYFGVTGGAITKNVIYDNVQANKAHNLSTPGSAVEVTASQGVLVDGNTAYRNHGVGIDVDEGSMITVRGNTAYDNLTANIAAAKVRQVAIDANFVYCTGDTKYNTAGQRPLALTLGSLVQPTTGGKKNTITNNILARCAHNLAWNAGAAGTGLKATMIANNTLAQAILEGISFDDGASHAGSTFTNNIVIQSNTTLADLGNRPGGLAFSSNNWLGGVPTGTLKGAGDLLANCNLANVNGTKPADFKLPKGSPCIDKGKAVAEVKRDFFGNARPQGGGYDIGAHEYVSAPAADAAVKRDAGAKADATIADARGDLKAPPKGDGAVPADMIDPLKGDGAGPRDGAAKDRSANDQRSGASDAPNAGDGQPADDGGCGCAVGDLPSGAGSLAALLLLALFSRRRRSSDGINRRTDR